MAKKVKSTADKFFKFQDPLLRSAGKKAGVDIADPFGNLGKIDTRMNPKMPGETQAEADLRARQAEDLAELDEEENRRIKQLLSASRGTRAYRGSPMFRARPSNTAGRARTATGAGAAGAGAAGMRAGGGRGGLVRTLGSLIR